MSDRVTAVLALAAHLRLNGMSREEAFDAAELILIDHQGRDPDEPGFLAEIIKEIAR